MKLSAIRSELEKFLPGEISFNEPLSRHTTWGMGGAADIFLLADTLENLQLCLKIAKNHQLDFFILGNGSNLLVSDYGVAGMVIKLGREFKKIKWHSKGLLAGTAARLPSLVNPAIDRELAGLNCLAGIPGTLGGALIMNAGAWGGQIGKMVSRVALLTPELNLIMLEKDDLKFSYRKGNFPKNSVLLAAELALLAGKSEQLKKEKEELLLKRKKSQPGGREGKSAGSVFLNPPGPKAWELIDRAGFRGYTLGKVKVSNKHPNFILNLGGAKAQEVWNLIEKIQKAVAEKSGIHLTTEIERVGRW